MRRSFRLAFALRRRACLQTPTVLTQSSRNSLSFTRGSSFVRRFGGNVQMEKPESEPESEEKDSVTAIRKEKDMKDEFYKTLPKKNGGFKQDYPTFEVALERGFRKMTVGTHSIATDIKFRKVKWVQQFLKDTANDSVKQRWPELAQLADKIRTAPIGSVKLTDRQFRMLGQRYNLTPLFDTDFQHRTDNSFLARISQFLCEAESNVITQRQYDVTLRILKESKALETALQNEKVRKAKAVQGFLRYSFSASSHPLMAELRKVWVNETQGEITDSAIAVIRLYESKKFGHTKTFTRYLEVETVTVNPDGSEEKELSSKYWNPFNEFGKLIWKYPDTFGKRMAELYFADELRTLAECRQRVKSEGGTALELLDAMATTIGELTSAEQMAAYMEECAVKFECISEAKKKLEQYLVENHSEVVNSDGTAVLIPELKLDTGSGNGNANTSKYAVEKQKLADLYVRMLAERNDDIWAALWNEAGSEQSDVDTVAKRLVNRWRVNNDTALQTTFDWLPYVVDSDPSEVGQQLADLRRAILNGEQITAEMSQNAQKLLDDFDEL